MSRIGSVPPTEVDARAVAAHADLAVADSVLYRLAVAFGDRVQHRRLVYLVGPPGAGKSTLAAVLSQRARERGSIPWDVAAVSMDGFHHSSDHLASHRTQVDGLEVPLTQIKGHPDTFDVKALRARLQALRSRDVKWPTYDREIHDVRPGTEPVRASVVVVEGNWLALDAPIWRELGDLADFTIVLDADRALLRERLIARKARGGLSRSEAEAFYERSDRRNVELFHARTDLARADLVITTTDQGNIELGERA